MTPPGPLRVWPDWSSWARFSNDGLIDRNGVTNWGDFSDLAKRWAKISVNGLTELMSRPPIPAVTPAVAR